MQLFSRLKQQLFRWHSDGTESFRLGQRRVFIVPSHGGLLFSGMLIVMLLGAINYDLALGHALVFLLAGIGLTGMVHTFRNLYDLLITPGRAEPVFVGENAYFQMSIGNERKSPRLALEFEASPDLPLTVAVNAQSSRKIAIPVPARQRGWLTLPRIRLRTRYPLGLFTAWSYLQPDMRCLVYPQALPSPLPSADKPADGNEHRGDTGQEDFAGFRDRQPADSLRHIAWKLDARHGGSSPLLIKQFAGGADAELALDWQQTNPELAWETRISLLCGWVLKAHADGLRYGLELPGNSIPAGNGEAHYRQCLEALALSPA